MYFVLYCNYTCLRQLHNTSENPLVMDESFDKLFVVANFQLGSRRHGILGRGSRDQYRDLVSIQQDFRVQLGLDGF